MTPSPKQKARKVKAWCILVDGKPNVSNGMFETRADAERVTWRKPQDEIIECVISYLL